MRITPSRDELPPNLPIERTATGRFAPGPPLIGAALAVGELWGYRVFVPAVNLSWKKAEYYTDPSLLRKRYGIAASHTMSTSVFTFGSAFAFSTPSKMPSRTPVREH